MTLVPSAPQPPSGPAGGDLTGTYPNPSVAKINGSPLGTTSGAATGAALVWNGSAWVPSSESVAGVRQTATKNLTASDLLAIFTTAVTILPSPGASLAIMVEWVNLNYLFGTTPYTDHGGSLCVFPAGTTAGAPGPHKWSSIATNGLWTPSANQMRTQPATNPAATGNYGPVASTEIVNQGLKIQQDTANPTGGDGTIVVTVAFTVIAAS